MCASLLPRTARTTPPLVSHRTAPPLISHRYVAWYSHWHCRGAISDGLAGEVLGTVAVALVRRLAKADRGIAMGCALGVGYDRMLLLAEDAKQQSSWMDAVHLLVAASLLSQNGLRLVGGAVARGPDPGHGSDRNPVLRCGQGLRVGARLRVGTRLSSPNPWIALEA